MKVIFSLLVINGLLLAAHIGSSNQDTHINTDNNTETNQSWISDAENIIPADAPEEYMEVYEIAEDYLTFTPLSKSRLYELMLIETDDIEAAQYVVETVNVDWGKNARQKAYNLLQVSGMSKRDMIDQLAFEGYTEESIQFAIKDIY